MDCVTVLAADTFMKPGAIVEYEDQKGTPRASLPVADLFGTAPPGGLSCLVPGADVASFQSGLSQRQPISIPQMTYEVNQSLPIGADIEIPALYGFTLKAGPKWSNVSKIDLANDDAWAIQVDELSAINAYRSCRI